MSRMKHSCDLANPLFWLVGWLCFTSHRQRGHLETAPYLLSLAKDVKLGFYTVPTGNRTRAVARQSITLPLRHASSSHCDGHLQAFHIVTIFMVDISRSKEKHVKILCKTFYWLPLHNH